MVKLIRSVSPARMCRPVPAISHVWAFFFELLHDARPLLLDLGQPGDLDIAPWAARIQLIDASYHGEWELPALGTVSAPTPC